TKLARRGAALRQATHSSCCAFRVWRSRKRTRSNQVTAHASAKTAPPMNQRLSTGIEDPRFLVRSEWGQCCRNEQGEPHGNTRTARLAGQEVASAATPVNQAEKAGP